jgi:type II secretory pathway pseudopilin PulG
MQKLFYYKVGLGVIGLFTLGIFIFAVVQGAGAKQDTQTDKAAQKIASKLNDYVDNNQRIPKTLAEADIHENTAHITYTKISDEKYKFCVDYKTASEDYTSSVESVVGRGLYGGVSSSSSSPSSSSEDQYSLYIGTSHKKGQNCQTVAPYIYSASSDSSDSSLNIGSSSSDASACPDKLYPNDVSFTGAVTNVDYATDASQDVTITIKPDSGAAEKKFTVKPDAANIYDDSCNSIPQTYFLEGDKVTVYQQAGDTAGFDAIVDSL